MRVGTYPQRMKLGQLSLRYKNYLEGIHLQIQGRLEQVVTHFPHRNIPLNSFQWGRPTLGFHSTDQRGTANIQTRPPNCQRSSISRLDTDAVWRYLFQLDTHTLVDMVKG
jgi:hypothetical protein